MALKNLNNYLNGNNKAGSNSAYDFGTSDAASLYAGYLRQIESEEERERRRQEQEQKRIARETVQNARLVKSSGIGDIGNTDFDQKSYKAVQAQEDALHKGAQNILDGLDPIKNGEVDPTKIQTAQTNIDGLSADTQELLRQYSADTKGHKGLQIAGALINPLTRGVAATSAIVDKVKYNKLKEETGLNDEAISRYINDINTVDTFKKEKADGKINTYLTPTQELQYAQASIDSLSRGERELINNIRTAQEDQYYNDANTAWGGVAMGGNMGLVGEELRKERSQINDTIESNQKLLKEKYGWDDDKIKNFTLMSKRLADAKDSEEMNSYFTVDDNDSKASKVAKGVGSLAYNAMNAPSEGIVGALSNLEERPEGFGRNMNSWVNMQQNTGDYAQEQVTNQINNPVGKFAYNVANSIGESATTMAVGGFLGAGEAGAVGQIAKGASLVPFAATAYNSGYNEARERGASDFKAQEYGIAAGLAEAGTEAFSLDHFWDMAKGTKAGKNILINWLAQAGIEGSEEAASDILNRISDYMILGNEGKSKYEIAVSDYMADGKTEREARRLAEKDFWVEVGQDALAGAASGAVMGGAGVRMGYKTAKYNQQYGEAIKEHYTKNDTLEDAERYKDNDVQYMADNAYDGTEKAKEAKANLQQYADRVANGETLSKSDRADIQQSLWVAEQELENDQAALDERDKYRQYKSEVSQVPAEYRSQSTDLTREDAYTRMADAAKRGDAQTMGEVYQEMKISRSAETRKFADDYFNQFMGMAETHGASAEELEASKVSQQEAYSMAMRGEEVANLSNQAREAYTAGQLARVEMKKQTEVASVNNAAVETTDGKVVTLTPVFTEGGAVTASGETIDVSDIQVTNATQKAYYYADAQKSLIGKNAYIQNIPEGMNINSYNMGFKAMWDAGEQGLSFESQQNGRNGFYIEGLGVKTARAIYEAGVSYSQQIRQNNLTDGLKKAFNVEKGTGTFTDARTKKASKIDTKVLKLIANVTGVNINLVDSMGDGVQADFNPKTSTITVSEGSAAQVFHEIMGEFAQFYNSTEYETLRGALMDVAQNVLGVKRFNAWVKEYQKAYAKAKQSHSAIEMTDEMTNDLLVMVMQTKKGQRALTNYLVEHSTLEEVKSLKSRISELFAKIKKSIESLFDNTNLNGFQKETFEKGQAQLEELSDMMIKVLDGAIANYQATEEGTELNGDTAFSLDISDERKILDRFGIQWINRYQHVQKQVANTLEDEGFFEKYGSLTNEKSRVAVELSKGRIKESFGPGSLFQNLGRQMKLLKLASVDYIPETIEKGEYTGKDVINRHDKSKPKFDYITHRVTEGDNEYDIRISIKKTQQGNKFHVHMIDIIEKEDSSLTAVHESGQMESMSPHVENISSNDTSVNRNSLTVDSLGNSLSEGQQEFFKDSKVRDENGALKVMYHGTQEGGFHVFDPNKTDDGRSLFFTDELENAFSYSGVRNAYTARTLKTIDDLNAVFEEQNLSDEYEAVEENGKFILYEDGDNVAESDTVKGLFDEFIDWTGYDRGNGNYKVYLNLVNPMIIDAEDKFWNELADYNKDTMNKYESIYIDKGTKDGLYNIEWIDHENPYGESEVVYDISADEIKAKFGDYVAGRLKNTYRLTLDNLVIDKKTHELIPNNTREYAYKASQLGYDGVIFNNILDSGANSSDGVYSTVAIAFNSEQVKSVANETPTNDVDIRYSLPISEPLFGDDGLSAFYDEDPTESAPEKTYSEAAKILEEGMQALKGHKVDDETVRKVANKIKRELKSKVNVDDLADSLKIAFNQMQSAESVNYDDMMDIMNKIALAVVDEATTKEDATEYNNFIEAFKGKKIRLSEFQLAEIKSSDESFKQFRNSLLPITINATKGTVTLEEVWQELSEATGGILPADTNEGDMPFVLQDTFRALKPTMVNTFGGDREAVASDTAMRLIEEYLSNTPEAKAKVAADKMREKNKEYRAKVRERYNQKLKEAKEKIKEQYKDKMQDFKADQQLKIADIRAKNKEQNRKARERRLANHEKKMIIKQANKLIKAIENPTEKNHVPKDMVEPLIEFLDAFDFIEPEVKVDKDGKYYVRIFDHKITHSDGSYENVFNKIVGDTREDVLIKFHALVNNGYGSQTQKSWLAKTQSLRNILQKIRNKENFNSVDMDGMFEAIDGDIIDELEYELEQTKFEQKISINNLNYETLRAVKKMLNNIAHAIDVKNKSFMNNEYIEDMARPTIELAGESTTKTELNSKLARMVHKLITTDMLTAETFMTLNNASTVYDELREGMDKEKRNYQNIQKFMLETRAEFGEKNVKAWTGNNADMITFKVHNGSITLTTGQIMALYETTKRKIVGKHFIGGVKVSDINKGVNTIKQNKVYHLTASDIENITSTLTDEQKRFADQLQKYMATEGSRMGNETSMRLFGYEKFTEKDYFPIFTNKDMIASTNDNVTQEGLHRVKNAGYTKALVKDAKNSIVIKDIMDVFTQHMSGMATYNGMTPALEDATRWLNYRSVTKDGEFHEEKSVKQALNEINPNGAAYVTNLLVDLNGGEVNADRAANILGALGGKMKAASIAFNIRVAAQQWTAGFRAVNVLDGKYMVGITPTEYKEALKMMKETSDIAWWKSQGYFDTSVGRSIKEIITGDESKLSQLRDAGMWLAGEVDDKTWAYIYAATIKETKALHPELTGDAFTQAVNKRFNEVIDKTQVVDSTLHRSQFMRSKNGIAQMQSAFMAEPTKSFNMLYEAFMLDARDFKNGEKFPKRTLRALFAWTLSNLANAFLAQAVIDVIRRNKDDEDLLETYLEAAKGDFLDNENPLALVPGARDIWTLISSNYSANTYGNYGMDAMRNALNATKELMKFASGESDKTAYGMIWTIAQPVSQFTGTGVHNVVRDLVGVYNLFGENLYKTHSEELKATKSSMITSIDEGTDDWKDYVNDLLDAGKSGDSIKQSLTTAYKADIVASYEAGENVDSRIEDIAEAKAYIDELTGKELADKWDGDYKAYEENQIRSGWLGEKSESALLSEERKGYKEALYKAIDTGSGDYQATIYSMAQSGMSAESIKSAITTQYKAQLVADYQNGKDISGTANRLAIVRAYVDYLYGIDRDVDDELKTIAKWLK